MGIFDDEDKQIDNIDKNIRASIRDFIKANYKGVFKVSKTINADGKYEVSSVYGVVVTNKEIESLTNGLFVWTEARCFDCSDCYLLTSLEGAPEKVGEKFTCFRCRSLKTLEGAPKEVGITFDCSSCKSLTSLEGAPREVGGSFVCSYCDDLVSLSGSPEAVGKIFDCSHCKNLESLDGVPISAEIVLNCSHCPKLTSFKDLPQRVSSFRCKGCSGVTRYIDIIIRNNSEY